MRLLKKDPHGPCTIIFKYLNYYRNLKAIVGERFFVLWTIIIFVNYYNTSGSHGQVIERSGEGSRNEFIGI